MHNAPPRTVFDAITDFLATEPAPQEILSYHLPEDLQERAHHLLDKNAADELTEGEYHEMVDFMRADEMIALLKAKLKVKQKKQSE